MKTPLQRVREKVGLTQREVATENGIDPGQYSRIENGKESITPSNAEKLSRFFGGRITELELIYPKRYSVGSGPSEAA